MELYEQLLMEIQDGLQAVRDEQSGLEQVRSEAPGDHTHNVTLLC